jgi:hypothetical protein
MLCPVLCDALNHDPFFPFSPSGDLGPTGCAGYADFDKFGCFRFRKYPRAQNGRQTTASGFPEPYGRKPLTTGAWPEKAGGCASGQETIFPKAMKRQGLRGAFRFVPVLRCLRSNAHSPRRAVCGYGSPSIALP